MVVVVVDQRSVYQFVSIACAADDHTRYHYKYQNRTLPNTAAARGEGSLLKATTRSRGVSKND